MDTYPTTARTTALRLRERMSYDAGAVHGVLDEALHCSLAFVVDGEPRVLPTLHVRVGDTLYVHGSTGSRPLLRARAGGGVPVCVAVTLLDGLVLARSQFHHSANYRSVVAHGAARLVTADAEKRRVLAALVDKVAPGRSADTRPPDDRELAQTAVLALPLREVSVKARAGGAVDEPEDHALPYWAGVVPLRVAAGRARPEPEVTVPVPDYLRPPAASAWHEPVPLRGRHVTLVPLDLSHVDGLLAATADDEVYRFQLRRRPADRAGMAAIVAEALDDPRRVPYAQLSTTTGEVVGTTSYYAPDPANRGIAIGYTMLGKPWWRTAFNTEAKLLLMARAFDDLGAVRVEWHTDVRNERSQRAIERLGAVREGVLRKQRLRPDGTWRDTVQYAMTVDDWPAARERLTARLAQG